jgi:hypothetical protein
MGRLGEDVSDVCRTELSDEAAVKDSWEALCEVRDAVDGK